VTCQPLIASSLAIFPPIWDSAIILLSLAVLFAVSWVMFAILSMRSTSQKNWVTLSEWGRDRKIPLRLYAEENLPTPLDAVVSQRLETRFRLGGRPMLIVQFESFNPAGPAIQGETKIREGLWNLLVREIPTNWPPTGLRPTAASSSALDLFSLSSFSLVSGSERFVAYGTTSTAASSLTRSSVRGLLPPDVGLLLHGRTLVLDFSNRPFDTIEFDRMLAVAEQIASHLPQPDAGG
jgi:hypothetical protein